jgi:hypothetical protein
MPVLTGPHDSPDTAYVVNDYPYGFRLRCKIRYWIETKRGFGSRVVSQTTNPKRGDVWNKPKASTYTDIRVLFIDEATGYVENAGLSVHASAEKIAEFETLYGEGLTSRDKHVLNAIKILNVKMTEREAARKAAEGSL